MITCLQCDGFIPGGSAHCPNCGQFLSRQQSLTRSVLLGGTEASAAEAPEVGSCQSRSKPSWQRKLMRGTLATCTSMTLAACYGCPADECGGVGEFLDDIEEPDCSRAKAPTTSVSGNYELQGTTAEGGGFTETPCAHPESSSGDVQVVSIPAAGTYRIRLRASEPLSVSLYQTDQDDVGAFCGTFLKCRSEVSATPLPGGMGGMGGAGNWDGAGSLGGLGGLGNLGDEEDEMADQLVELVAQLDVGFHTIVVAGSGSSGVDYTLNIQLQ